MSNVIFLTGIENLSIRTTPGRGDVVANAFSITTDRDFLEKHITAGVREAIGNIEVESLISGRPVAYSMPPVKVESEVEANKHLEGWLHIVTLFLLHNWFVKDNAAGMEFGYVVWKQGRVVNTTRNFLGMVVTDARGTTDRTSLSSSEFREVRELFTQRLKAAMSAPLKGHRHGRLERALSFVSAARMSGETPVKIANYCTALEALFSNDTSELTHKLSERTAWFVGEGPEERVEVFQRIRKAYGIRSKVVHGAPDWSRDDELARNTSTFLDSLLRSAFRRVEKQPELFKLFSDETEAGRKRHDDFLLSLVLGSR